MSSLFNTAERESHEVDYRVGGTDTQYVEVTLDPGEKVIAEPGSMMWMDQGIGFEVRMGDGTEPDATGWQKLKSAGRRALSGESVFMSHFTNNGGERSTVGFSAPYPGHIVPVDLRASGGAVHAQSEAFLCAAFGTKVDVVFQRKLRAGFAGGEGFVLQKLTGDGYAFLHAGGSIIQRELRDEELTVDTGSVVAFDPSVEFRVERSGSGKERFFGGEGLFLTKLSGSGRVWLQSLPFSSLVWEIHSRLPARS